MRHINESRAVQELFRRGPMSRADLGRRLSLTRSTAGSIVLQLAEKGMVREGAVEGPAASRTGRPGVQVSLRGDYAYFLGAEIGVEKLTTLALDFAGRTVWKESYRYDEGTGPEAALRLLQRAIAAFRGVVGAGAGIEGVCVTVPGLLWLSGEVFSTPILGWTSVDLRALFAAGLPDVAEIVVENDANAFAMAESYLTAGSGGSAVYVFMDSGVGGGLVADGRLIRGQNGFAGEIGHMPIGEHGYAPGSAVPGSFESYVGKDALLGRIRHHGGAAAGLPELIARFGAGDAAARATVADWTRWLGRGLAALVAALDPGRIVLGGECAALAALCLPDIRAQIAPLLLKGRPMPTVEITAFGAEAVPLGAACILHGDFLSIDPYFVFGATGAA
ncbi:MAG: ROK family transcriptional regulator [Rhizobiales bacterium]|nr:ROK family transcriptional regulator [Hyphomicrobiales bacterium]